MKCQMKCQLDKTQYQKLKLDERLKEIRGNRSLQTVARDIGVSKATLSRIENGYDPDVNTFLKVFSWVVLREACFQ